MPCCLGLVKALRVIFASINGLCDCSHLDPILVSLNAVVALISRSISVLIADIASSFRSMFFTKIDIFQSLFFVYIISLEFCLADSILEERSLK